MNVKVYKRDIELFEIEIKDGVVGNIFVKESDILNPFSYKNGFTNQSKWDNFIKTRVFDEKRGDCKELLEAFGLLEYNPIEIAKKTHGIMFSDDLWLRFNDEDFTWEDAYDILYS